MKRERNAKNIDNVGAFTLIAIRTKNISHLLRMTIIRQKYFPLVVLAFLVFWRLRIADIGLVGLKGMSVLFQGFLCSVGSAPSAEFLSDLNGEDSRYFLFAVYRFVITQLPHRNVLCSQRTSLRSVFGSAKISLFYCHFAKIKH